MEKKRRVYLKPWVEKTLTFITMVEFMLFASIDDFELRAIPILIIWLAVILFNIYILTTYGKETQAMYECEE